MKKILILLTLTVLLITTGCSTNTVNDAGEVNKTNTTKEAVSEEKTNVVKEETDNKESQHFNKEEYLKKLNLLEKEIGDLDYLYKNGVTSEIVKAEATKFERWDDMLNEIYSVLKTQLTESELKGLESSQQSFTKKRDRIAKNISRNGKGGSQAEIQYNKKMSGITKGRCYELVKSYMK